MPTVRASEHRANIAPIRCPRCGGKAQLARRTPDAFKRDGKTEHWTFECMSCGQRTEKTVEV